MNGLFIVISKHAKITYTLKKSRRARKARIYVQGDGTVTVSLPYFLKKDAAEQLVRQNADWIRAKIKYFTGAGNQTGARYSTEDYRKYKKAALELVESAIMRLNAYYGHSYKTVRIKNQKTCWGSCSRNGNLNFNFRILFLPVSMQEYIITHELCHLKELNHSQVFWELVGKTVPEYARIRRELRKNRIGFM